MIVSNYSTFAPFSILFNGINEFIVHKGFVFHAGNGTKITPKIAGEDLTHCWTDEGSKLIVASGQSIIITITHGSKQETAKYNMVDLESAEISVGEVSDGGDTTTILEIGRVEYDEGSYSPDIIQSINSDIYLAIMGTSRGEDG